MTKKEIKKRIKIIASYSRFQYDAAHQDEDDLMRDFIEYVAKNAPEPFRSKAREVLKVKDLDFPRYTA